MANEQRIEAYKQRILSALKENVPAPLKETFMISLSSILRAMEDEGIDRIDVFNPVYAALGEENRPKR